MARKHALSAASPLRIVRGFAASRLLGRHRPLFVNIEPTHRCNLACTFCDKHEGPLMKTEDVLRVLDELAAAGTISVCFDGGEPLSHPGIGEIVGAARRHGFSVSMSTNGTLLPRRIDQIAEANVLKISLDGPEAIHDRGRGAGAFQRTIEGIRVAKAHGLWVVVRMTLAEHNVRAHREVLAVAESLGVRALFQPAIGSLFDATEHQADHSPHVRAYRETIDDLIALKKAGAPVQNEFVALRHLRAWPDPNPVPFCGGGRVSCAIGPDGGLFPCGRVGRGGDAPNVLELGVAEAFARATKPTDCASCWCTLTVSNNYAYRFDPRLLEGHLFDPRRPAPVEFTETEVGPEAPVDEPLVQLRRRA